MSQLGDLYNEITSDPLVRGYSGMTDAQIAADLNTVYRTKDRSSMSGDEIYQQTVPSAFQALTDSAKQLWMAFCARETINPFANANVQTVVQLFGAGSQTVLNLQASRVNNVSRAQELGLGEVTAALVETARLHGG